MEFLQLISQPWHWAISGAMLAVVLFLLLWFGGEFGVSGNLRTLCAIGGAGKKHDFFNFNWRAQIWNLVFIGGTVIGGYIGAVLLQSPEPVQVAEATQNYLQTIGIHAPQTHTEGAGFVPEEIFATETIFSLYHLAFLTIGGLFIGFGTRWAGGCTSGHAISGLSNLQPSSLLAVVGFFIGGLLMTWVIFPQFLALN